MDTENKMNFSFLKKIGFKENFTLTSDFILCAVFSLMMLLYYPLGIMRAAAYGNPIRNWSLLEGFTWETIGYFALALTALKADKLFAFLKKHIFAAFGVIIYICILLLQQFFIFPSFYYFGGGISYLALICVGFLYAEEWKKLLLPFLWILFIASIAMNIHDFVYGNTAGLTGNWNWSSTLTLVSGTSIFFIFGGKLPAFERKWGFYFSLLTIILLIYIYFVGHFPKGTIFSSIIALCVLFWCYLDYFMSRKMRYIILAAAIVVIGITAVLQKDFIAVKLKNDTRIFLWENGLKVIAENPFIGCEYGRYITVSADKMAPEYFLSGHAAVIHNHPHNEFLFHLANYGIGGIVLILLMLYILVMAIRLFERQRNFFNGYFLFIYTVLLVHSMVDVTLMHWPCNLLFYLAIGALIPMMGEKSEPQSRKTPFYLYLSAIIFLLLGCYLFFMNFMSSLYYRRAVSLGKDYAKRLSETRKSLSYRPTYKTVNDVAALANSPEERVMLMLDMKKLTGIENYSHSNLTIANTFMELKMPEQALKYYEKEQQCFPLSVRNLFFFRNSLMQLKKREEAIAVEKMIFEIIKMKNLDRRHINILIRYPEYDLNSSRIPANLLKPKGK